jgi:transposase
MQVRYRYRIYPSAGQRQALARAFGCARVVYNDCVRVRDEAYAAGEKISDTEVQRRVVTLGKPTPERAWLAEVASVALVQACQDARRAYRNWFDSLSGKRKGRKVGHPVFRRKHHRQSIRLTRNGFTLHGLKLYKARHRVAVIHCKVREARLDHAHKTALRLVRDSQAVYAEDLAVSGLMRTRLAKSVDGPKPLSVRTWACAACGAVHDRDINAARNILAAGRADKSNACGGQVRPAALLAPVGEAGTLRGAA